MANYSSDEEKQIHDDLMSEYYAIYETVSAFDQRLLTIKSWGVTFGLATLGLGFQQDHYGLFLVAAISALAFWALEAVTKLHQMRHFPRMGDIEQASYELFHIETESGAVSSPLIDWSWWTAKRRVPGALALERQEGGSDDGQKPPPPHRVPTRWGDLEERDLKAIRKHPIRFIHVMVPHVITIVAGCGLFVLGLFGFLGPL